MNLNQHPTLGQLIQIIGGVDDNQDSHILYVNKNGDVHLDVFRADTAFWAGYSDENNLQFVLDTFMIGKGYTGQQAILDAEWMEEVFSELKEHWACRTTGFAWKTS